MPRPSKRAGPSRHRIVRPGAMPAVPERRFLRRRLTVAGLLIRHGTALA
jgi:hypothetical protein